MALNEAYTLNIRLKRKITMYKTLPEMEWIINKSFTTTVETFEFQRTLFAETLKFFNALTDKNFYTYTVKAAETVNSATDYAKENLESTQSKVTEFFGGGK
jgi:hypothetical protein